MLNLCGLSNFLLFFMCMNKKFTVCRYGQDFVSQSAPKYDIRKLPCIMTQASFVNILLEWCAKGDF